MKWKLAGIGCVLALSLIFLIGIVKASSKPDMIEVPKSESIDLVEMKKVLGGVVDEGKEIEEVVIETEKQESDLEVKWDQLVLSDWEQKELELKIKEREKELEESGVVDISLNRLGKKGAIVVKKKEPEQSQDVDALYEDMLEDEELVQPEEVEIVSSIIPEDVEVAPQVESSDVKPLDITPVKYDKDKMELEDLGTFEVTAYDLSVTCCDKPRDHPQFGITKSGASLIGLSREEAMAVAVDESVIPLGTKLYLELPEPYKSFSGIYTALDTGNPDVVKGKILDLYMGDFGKDESDQRTRNFGRQHAKVYLVK